uniref:Uncharacterized protein n=1 Tax=Aegilops tauschii subsp. strangulata TaxID=200361 RepID=A0A453E262_AEGTS
YHCTSSQAYFDLLTHSSPPHRAASPARLQNGDHRGRAEHEAAGGHQGAARAVRGGGQGRGGLPVLPPLPARRHRRQAAREGLHGRQRRQPLRQRREARRHLRPARRRQGRAPPPRRPIPGRQQQKLPPLRLAAPTVVPPGPLVDECGRQLSCSGCRSYMTGTRGTACPSCGGQMSKELKLVPSAVPGRQAAQEAGGVTGKGFVQGIVTYTVMDDLTVTPMSSMSSITLLNTFGVRDLGALEEKTLQLSYNEGLDILKASLQSKTVLTDVFLKPSKV